MKTSNKQDNVLQDMNSQIIEKQIFIYEEWAGKALSAVEGMRIRKFEDIMDMADFLLPVKETAKEITDRKKEIAQPSPEVAALVKSFKKIEEAYAEIEKIGKEKLLKYVESQWNKGKVPDNKICGLKGNMTVIEKSGIEIIDETSIPRDLCSPDTEKIEHYLKSGKILEGATLVKNYTIAIGKN